MFVFKMPITRLAGTALIPERIGKAESREGSKQRGRGANFELSSGVGFAVWIFPHLVAVLTMWVSDLSWSW